MLTVEQLAQRAGVSARTVRALIAAKALPAVARDGQVVVAWQEWEAFVAACPVSEWVTSGARGVKED